MIFFRSRPGAGGANIHLFFGLLATDIGYTALHITGDDGPQPLDGGQEGAASSLGGGCGPRRGPMKDCGPREATVSKADC